MPSSIANARMYEVSPAAADAWRDLLNLLIAQAGLAMEVVAHAAPAPLEALWSRSDLGAVFMCGLPFSRAEPPPFLLAAPVPAPAPFGGEPCYWSEWVVREDTEYRTVADTFGGRLALTVPQSQSGCLAALADLATAKHALPLFADVVAPTVTPLRALSAVIDGAADIAPIDAYAFCLLQRYRPDLTSKVRRVGRTETTPIPPLVSSLPPSGSLQNAFLGAHRHPPAKPLLERLLLERFVCPQPDAYQPLRRRFEATIRYWRAHALAARIHPVFAL